MTRRLEEETANRLTAALNRELTFWKLDDADKEDIRQEVLAWVLTLSRPPKEPSRAWAAAVVRLFVRSHRKSSKALERRRAVLSGAPPVPFDPRYEEEILVEQILLGVSERERSIVIGLGEGLTWAQSLRLSGVPQGSHAIWKRRIRRRIRRLLDGPSG